MYDSKTPSVQIIRSQLNVGGWGGVLPILSSRGQILSVPGIIQIPQQQNRCQEQELLCMIIQIPRIPHIRNVLQSETWYRLPDPRSE